MHLSFGINPNTIQKAYSELENKKIIASVGGKGSFISKDISVVLDNKKQNLIKEIKLRIEELQVMGMTKEEIVNLIK